MITRAKRTIENIKGFKWLNSLGSVSLAGVFIIPETKNEPGDCFLQHLTHETVSKL